MIRIPRKKPIRSRRKPFRTASLLATLAACLFLQGCTFSYSFSGASINYATTRTASIAYFNNLAAMVSPLLSPTFTDELKNRIASQTRLQIVNEDGDLDFQGEIVDYRSDPVSISADEYALKNRLTITVRVRFTNKADPHYSFEKTFSEYEDYDTSILLTQAEQSLIPEIVDKLVDNIFNEALSNW